MSEAKNTGSGLSTRHRILNAAETLARTLGPANISLDAVAAAAGVSKGGLLYHFPSKARLLEGVVENHLKNLDISLKKQENSGQKNAVIISYLQHFLDEQDRNTHPPSGLLAALAENPQMLTPVREHTAVFLQRIRSNASDPDLATLAYLAVDGLRSAELLGTQVLGAAERRELIKRAMRCLADQPDRPPAVPPR
ncbi:TetR/AcrR family transcriptional regulator [Roseinatronobacter alkalisoli]|uniref:TetR/AcrR family transcriptional regulator n=1 Tax=Roseinatronobacter alkalisoli TaxID=3028235 RepID=A0ABT5TES8_9RHOB|nr:TetR/AcrR family transcriptional regulator [Roseinatronobacter sp. HJB301]MDD7972408.1 TetR/AcrR family transcriptional regulator [Roseinatronobacter sp. HJB301]